MIEKINTITRGIIIPKIKLCLLIANIIANPIIIYVNINCRINPSNNTPTASALNSTPNPKNREPSIKPIRDAASK